MKLGTIPFSELLTYSEDIYKNTIVAAKRAKQIVSDRALKRNVEFEMLMEDYIPSEVASIDNYEEKDKALVTAVEEFLNNEIEIVTNDIDLTIDE